MARGMCEAMGRGYAWLLCSAMLGSSAGVALAQEEPADSIRYVMPRVEVVGEKENLDKIPGSASVLDAKTLVSAHVFTANEALRKMPGVSVRDEEGFGLRPNVGIRGLNPTRTGFRTRSSRLPSAR
jgi:Fe(3+) dicitrate transport protein